MEEENKDPLEFQHLAGGNITKFPPLFSPDASALFVVTDRAVQVYSTSTGSCTRCLEGANDPLISLEYDIQDSDVLVGCTETGEVLRWKWSTGTIVSQVQLKMRSEARFDTFTLLNLHIAKNETLAFVTSTKRGSPSQCDVVNSVTGKKVECPLNLKLGRQRVKVVADRGSFKYVAVAQGAHVFFVNYKNWEWKRFNNANKVPITCLAAHPTECLLATGDESGKIMLWRQFFGHDTVRTVLFHWHHTSVTSIAFTASGSGFYSSGHEAVLVKWNILRPEQRNFVPRMASVIRHITTSEGNSTTAVCTADNGIQLLGVDFETQCTVQEFTYAFEDKTGNSLFPIGLKINPRKNTLVLNSRPGHLQFYSAYTKSLLYNMDVVGQNQLSMETGKILYNTQVTHAAFNIDWMATAEVFNDQQHLPELRLKFWEYQKEKHSYALNTNVELPHEGGMKAIEFSNPYNIDNLICATAGMDNFIKIWSLEDSGSIYKKGKVWYCVARTSYKNYPIQSIGFSQDSSLLAAGYGCTLCVYKAASLKLIAALKPHGALDGSLHKAQVSVKSRNKNGSQNLPKKDIIQLFTNLLQTKELSKVKDIKKAMSTKKIQPLGNLDDAQKELLFKRLRSTNQLNLFQKLIIYQRLGIRFQVKEEWHAKMKEYIEKNLVTGRQCKELQKEVFQLNVRSRFKAKYRLSKYIDRTASNNNNANSSLVPILRMLSLEETPKPSLTNGVGKHEAEPENNQDNFMPPVQSTLMIKTVAFCYGDFGHLVIACTETRVLIWDLLTLRLQTVLKLSTDHIAVDPLTNLISVFTKNHELYVFRPSVALPLYYRANMPNVCGAVWLPRKYPRPQAVIVNWQARSRLYFLTDKQEILYLAKKDEFEEPTVVFAGDADDPSQLYSTYGAFATNRIYNAETGTMNNRELAIGVHGKNAVESLLEMSSYIMPPLSLLCNDFLKSMAKVDAPKTVQPPTTEKDDVMEISDDSDKEEIDESIRTRAEILAKLSAKTKSTVDEEVDDERLRKIYEEPVDFTF